MRSSLRKKNRIRDKNNRMKSSGFSIAEMLLAVLILLLATGLSAQVFSLASASFFASTNKSEAQMICSTLSDFVRSELTCASEIKLSGEGIDSFIDESGRLGKRCKFDVVNEKLVMQQVEGSGKVFYPMGGDEKPYARNVKLTKFEIKATDTEKMVFNVVMELSGSNGAVLAKSSFYVMPFSTRKVENQ